jgi:hypothetical protein
MNLNKKITKFSGDGIPEYNKAINELIDAVNWLAGVRTINGKPIAESDQGPVLDLSQVNASQSPASPWANDPNGNQAGWQKILFIDPNYTSSGLGYLVWAWSGPALLQNQLSWLTDPNGVSAQWVQHNVCENGQVVSKWFWGTP